MKGYVKVCKPQNLPIKTCVLMGLKLASSGFLALYFQIFFIFLFANFASAYESVFENLSLKKDFYVVRANKGEIYTDLGQGQGAFKGLRINIYKQMESIKHPITGELLGITKDKICEGSLTQVFQRYSIAETNCTDAAVKDIIDVDLDLKVYINVKNEVDEYFKRLVENDVISNGFKSVQNADEADLIIDVAKVYRGEFTVNLRTKADILLASKVIKEAEKVSSEGQFKDRKRYEIDRALKSIALSDVDSDGQRELVGASNKKVYIYKVDNDSINRKYTFGKFENIINIEAADVNNNGYPEIFIVDYPYAGKLNTYIYEYDTHTYVQKAILPYFVRSVIDEDAPSIIGQKQHFEYLARGDVFTLTYEDGRYKEGPGYDTPEGFKLYGFYSEGSDSLYIGDDGKIYKAKSREIVDSTAKEVGRYVNIYDTQMGFLEGDKRKDLFHEEHDQAFKPREKKEKALFKFSPKSRIFKYDNFLYAFINIPITAFIEGSIVITSSRILQMNIESMLVNYIGSDLSKNVYDMYMYRDNFGEYHIYVLETESEVLGLGSAKSNIVVLKY
jgi:hypothetical protein